MGESADFDESGAIATSISTTSLTGTGLAKESGGNLDAHTALLSGAQVGALISGVGRTVGQEVAALIASGSAAGTPGGAPLLHGARHIFGLNSQVIAASGVFTQNNILFTRPGYMINVRCQMSGINAVLPSVECDLTWSVGAIANGATAEEIWYVPAGGSATKRTTGRGPTKGDTLQLTLRNGDATDSVTVNVDVWETTQHMARDDWRSDGAVASSGASAMAGTPHGLMIGNDSFTVPGSTTIIRNMPLYAGQANIWINQNVSAGAQVQIVPGGTFNPVLSNPIASLDWTAAPHQLIGVILPRAWCQLLAFNTGAGSTIFTFGITALEYAS